MSLTSYRAAPPRVCGVGYAGRPGGDRLSRALWHSIMGAGGFHGRVRDGIGCAPPAMATRSSGISWSGSGACDGFIRVRDARVGVSEGGVLVGGLAAVHGGDLEPVGRLGPVSCVRCRTFTPGLST